MRTTRSAWLCGLLVLAAVSTSSAQQFTGGLRGAVRDANGVIPGVTVTLTNEGVHPEDHCEVMAGWLNVLFPLKAAVDHGIDLRNHDPSRTWDHSYADQ